ncbi:endonuclease domain-containing protein [Algoriphagus winogradskyi]|uniref:Very-short-patch-repair endonuclease n=1 Tax=Algoriphagus winogradskyi TaxID=237017 RepID=A0ABY1P4Y9_9BACT|nr:endonuclease domain-containing protein [Algoriphagus winogradskyi]SMP26477.1 Very-short-patch-repair endonuclease [Algoriphagus winogradskyi]
MLYSSNLFYGASAATHQKAKELRNKLTLAERKLWTVLQNKQLGGYKFRRQYPIYKYIADFYCHELSLVIELDGGVHDGLEQKEHDLNRDQVIQEFGIQILRFKNEEVIGDIREVIRQIKGFLL